MNLRKPLEGKSELRSFAKMFSRVRSASSSSDLIRLLVQEPCHVQMVWATGLLLSRCMKCIEGVSNWPAASEQMSERSSAHVPSRMWLACPETFEGLSGWPVCEQMSVSRPKSRLLRAERPSF